MRTAAYARYSSDQQSAASLEDQLRNCRTYCARQGWPDPEVFRDAAISGSRTDRPAYCQLLARAGAGEFDVVLVDDLSRLGRDSAEVQAAIKRLRFAGVRLIGVSDGVDTGRKGHKVEVGLRGLMGELYLDDLADKTHRGLTGRALAGASAGGLPYGYRKGSEAGSRVIDPTQADVVRRIFADYLAGKSPRHIAAELNRAGVASARPERAGRPCTWSPSAIHGDSRRGLGILANPIYVGRQVWNRSQWVKHPDTGRRVRQERPESEWITTEHPELAIVDRRTWDAAQARLQRRASRGQGRRGPGRPIRNLLSGLLRCPECGGPIVVVDATAYGCSTAKERRTCGNRTRLPRLAAERAVLTGIQEQLLTDEAFEAFRRAYVAAATLLRPDEGLLRRRLAEAERVHQNVMAAIREGIITPSTKAELQRAEAEIEAARADLAAARRDTPARLVPQMRARWQEIVLALANRGRNLPEAREALRALLGDGILKTENGAILLEIAPFQIDMVAGVGFEPTTFGL